MSDSCCCKHDDAKECLRLMHPNDKLDIDDRCECCCHQHGDDNEEA